jgi:tRNA(fMet)-specific endonuclease VapC
MACLDTSAIIDYLQGLPEVVSTVRSYEASPEGISTTSVTKYELLKYRSPGKGDRMMEFISRIRVYSLDEASVEIAARDYLLLKGKGSLINELDILIAGISESKGEMLLTTDKDFKRLGRSNIKILG